jgi:beta-N-acetylhexosaminidase
MPVTAMVLGVAGHALSTEERAFYRDVSPWGFILFRRNVESPDQLRALTASLRECVGENAPIFVDQEGGRVQRLGPPHWRKYPPGRSYGRLLANDPLARREVTRLGARLIAHDLKAVGIDGDCLPVVDVPVEGAHDVIGDRAYATDPDSVAVLGRAAAEGLLAGGVLPVMKHIPGHGRAAVDSHLQLPLVDAELDALMDRDFRPFQILADLPIAMTAHVVYTAIDRAAPATTSRKVLRKIVRGHIGFEGLLMSDDLSMQALSGSLAERTEAAMSAGCDIALHCNGRMDEMIAVAGRARQLGGKAAQRARSALQRIRHVPEPLDLAEAAERFDAAIAALAA